MNSPSPNAAFADALATPAPLAVGAGGEWRRIAPYLLIVGLLFALAQQVGAAHDMHIGTIVVPYANRILSLAPLVVAGIVLGYTLFLMAKREPSPIRAMRLAPVTRFQSPAMFAAMAAAVVAVPYLMGAFGLLKMAIPKVVPFYADDALARADRILFFGHDPWRVTHALFGDPISTAVLDRIYTLWVPLVMVGVLLAACAKPRVRAQFFLSYALCWTLIGVAGAYALSSAGPCYAGRLGTETASWFAPLMDRLSETHARHGLGAVVWQSILWNSSVMQDYEFARGISAAPSLHNAICLLYVLALRNSAAVWRIGSILLAVAVWIGSIHLGWHYASDGPIAWIMMLAIWSAVGAYLDRVGYARDEAASADLAISPLASEPSLR